MPTSSPSSEEGTSRSNGATASSAIGVAGVVALALGVLGAVVCLALVFFNRWYDSRGTKHVADPLLRDDDDFTSSSEEQLLGSGSKSSTDTDTGPSPATSSSEGAARLASSADETNLGSTDSDEISSNSWVSGKGLEMTEAGLADINSSSASSPGVDDDSIFAVDDPIPQKSDTRREVALTLRSSPAPTFIADNELNIVMWSIGED